AHADAHVAVEVSMRLSRMDPDTHLDSRHCRERTLSRYRRRDGIRRPLEYDEEGITLGVDHRPAMLREGLVEMTTVLCSHVTPVRAVLARQLSRTLDVAEEKRHRSCRKTCAHMRIVG